MEFLKNISILDAFPKTLEDFRVRTYSGAIVSIVSGLFILFLLISEFSLYLSSDVHPQLFVDTTRGEKLQINFDIVFPKLPCSYVSLDVMDLSGESQLDVSSDIQKQRLNPKGREVVSEKRKRSLLSKPENSTDVVTAGCGSCYGSELRSDQCCNTCEEVRESYKARGWSLSSIESVEQCVKEGVVEELAKERTEGCRIFGKLNVNKVAGNFHFAPGKSSQVQQMHMHDMHSLYQSEHLDLSHRINRLSFGEEFPGIVNPLDNVEKDNKEPGVFQYFIKIVPTIYESLYGKIIKTNQYSVTEHYRATPHEDATQPGGHNHNTLPGVFFNYDLSPIMIKYTERVRSFAHFLTGVCAIVGGVFTVSGLIDSFIYTSIRSIQKKTELGKHY